MGCSELISVACLDDEVCETCNNDWSKIRDWNNCYLIGVTSKDFTSKSVCNIYKGVSIKTSISVLYEKIANNFKSKICIEFIEIKVIFS